MTLQTIMSALIIDAKLRPGKAAAVTLPHGLQIIVRIEKDPDRAANANILVLALSRKDAIPSTTEWITVLNALNPSYLPSTEPPEPKAIEYKGRQYLHARWPVSRAVLVTVR